MTLTMRIYDPQMKVSASLQDSFPHEIKYDWLFFSFFGWFGKSLESINKIERKKWGLAPVEKLYCKVLQLFYMSIS